MRYSWLGMNYANGLNGYIPSGGYPTAQVAADLAYIKKNLTNRVRIALPDWNFPLNQIQQLQQVCLDAMALGMEVSWGITSTNTLLTTQNQGLYAAAVLDQCTWAAVNGISDFFVANELDTKHNGTITDAQQRAFLRGLATLCKSKVLTPLGSSMKITYSVQQGKQGSWISEGKGDFDTIGLDLYEPYPLAFASDLAAWIAAFPGTGYLAEWNVVNGWSDISNFPDEVIAQTVARRARAIEESGIGRAFYFCYEHTFYSNPIASDNVWAARLADGSFRRLVQPLVQPRRTFE